MRKNKRNFSFILAAVMLAACLCSCTAKSAEKDGQAASGAAAQTQETAESQAAAEDHAAAEDQAAEAGAENAAGAEAAAAGDQAAEVAEATAVAQTGASAGTGDEALTESGIMPVYTLERHTNFELSDDLLIAQGSYEIVRLSEEAKEAYPALGEALDALRTEMSGQAEKQFGEIKEAAVSFRESYDGDLEAFPSGDMTCGIEPVRCDSAVLSFYESCTLTYPDAAHGFMGYTGYNYDTATGAAIALTDVITDLNALLPAVSENLVALGDGMPVTDVESELEEAFGQNGENLDWVIDRDALVLRFAPYDVAPYARGTVEARVPFAKYPDLFTGKYGRYDGAFVKKLNTNMPVAVDLDGDGETEPVFVTGTFGMEDAISLNYSELEVTVGTMGCAQQADFFSWNSVLVHTGDGRNIILVETRGDNDYPDLYVFEAGSKGPRAIGKMEGMAFAAAYREASGDDGEFLEEYPALDPSAFALKEWSDQGNKDVLFYEIGEDGMPVQLAD